ncbi:MAG: phospholipase D family protein [Proteobacteria bacterium]|nr:phospholipase D family protein [Pseudomonadota bacterium]
MRLIRAVFFIAVVLAIVIGVLRLFNPLPDLAGRTVETPLPPDPASPLAAASAAERAAHPGLSGVVPLRDGHDALASRLALIGSARHSIEAQYYIWHNDVSGMILLRALDQAARRGVAVRLLVDDNGVPGMDRTLAALAAQPNFKVRIFNPSTIRRPKLAGYAIDFFRMNRRMHNKALIVDGAAAIIGGRNIGDEYFQVGTDDFFLDLDVLASGAVVGETERTFYAYWNSASVFAAGQIIAPPAPGDIAAFRVEADRVAASQAGQTLLGQLESSVQAWLASKTAPEWTRVQLTVDDPVKGQGKARDDQLMITRLGAVLGGVSDRIDLASAYFIPGNKGTQWFVQQMRQGRHVRILTNAMNTTDVMAVHSGYVKYRRRLLGAGVTLYELRLRGGEKPAETGVRLAGLSGASLHAKTFAVDDARIFIGSFNFDPRSARLNCEMGFLIDSPAMARQLHRQFDTEVPLASYQPVIDKDGELIWREPRPDGTVAIHHQEPGTTALQRATLTVLRYLPIEQFL